MAPQRDSRGRFISGSGGGGGGGKRVRVVLNSDAIRQFLTTDPGIQQDLQRRADAIAAAAGPGFKSRVYRGRDRLRAQIWAATPRARRAEAQDRVLTKALDAARE